MSDDVFFITFTRTGWERNSFAEVDGVKYVEYVSTPFYEQITNKSHPVKVSDMNTGDEQFQNVFLNGSIQFYRWFNRFYRGDLVNPFDMDDYRVSKYLTMAGPLTEHFLNPDPEYTTASQMMKRNFTSPMFVKPDEGNKTFTGGVVPCGLAAEHLYLDDIEPHDFVCLSPAREVAYERRNIVIGDEIVTHSPYSYDEVTPVIPDSINEQMDEFLSYFLHSFSERFPDCHYVLDTCMSDGMVKIVEVNALATSGLYDADRMAITKAVQKWVGT